MQKNKLTWMILLAVVINDTLDSISQILMKKGLGKNLTGNVNLDQIGQMLFGTPESGMLWIGILIYSMNFFLWILILSKLDLSTAVPVASTNYITLPILAMIFLHEQISPLRWVGILFIILGIHFVSKSTYQPQKEHL